MAHRRRHWAETQRGVDFSHSPALHALARPARLALGHHQVAHQRINASSLQAVQLPLAVRRRLDQLNMLTLDKYDYGPTAAYDSWVLIEKAAPLDEQD